MDRLERQFEKNGWEAGGRPTEESQWMEWIERQQMEGQRMEGQRIEIRFYNTGRSYGTGICVTGWAFLIMDKSAYT